MLNEAIISLPKNGQGEKCDSENYCGICLSACLTKKHEWFLVSMYADIL